MTKETVKKSFPLWAKIVLGVIGLTILSWAVILLAWILGFALFQEGPLSVAETVVETTDLSSNEPLTMNAESAIKDYLAQANKEITADQVVASGDAITVDYIWRLNEKEVFDTSVQSVAEAAGLYNPQRNYEEGLAFTVGAGQMIPGFDEAVVGMKLGETKTVEIPAEKAYGERSDEMVMRVPLEEAGDTSGAQVGMKILLGGMYPAVITELTDTEIVFDLNHELAGKDLIFDITIKALQTKE